MYATIRMMVEQPRESSEEGVFLQSNQLKPAFQRLHSKEIVDKWLFDSVVVQY